MVPTSNDSSGSTRWERRLVKIVTPPEGRGRSGAKRLRWRHLARRNWCEPLTLTMQYKGGASARVEVKTRGDSWTYDGNIAIVEVLYDINGRGERSN